VATYGAESWTLNKNVAERLAAFGRKVLRRISGGIKANENWKNRCNKLLMQVFGDLDMLSFVRINLKNWISHVNRLVTYLTKKQMVELCTNVLIATKLRTVKRFKNRPDSENSVKEAKVRIGL